jgi:hypothetical protein
MQRPKGRVNLTSSSTDVEEIPESKTLMDFLNIEVISGAFWIRSRNDEDLSGQSNSQTFAH